MDSCQISIELNVIAKYLVKNSAWLVGVTILSNRSNVSKSLNIAYLLLLLCCFTLLPFAGKYFLIAIVIN